jgi:hypothetical protein
MWGGRRSRVVMVGRKWMLPEAIGGTARRMRGAFDFSDQSALSFNHLDETEIHQRMLRDGAQLEEKLLRQILQFVNTFLRYCVVNVYAGRAPSVLDTRAV